MKFFIVLVILLHGEVSPKLFTYRFAEFTEVETCDLFLKSKKPELKQSIEKSKADQKFIEARTESEEVTTSEDFKKKLPKIQEYLTNQLAKPIEAAVFIGEEVNLLNKENAITQVLNSLLSSMDITAETADIFKQSVKIKVPKEGGGTKSVTIDLKGKSGINVFDEILKLAYSLARHLEKPDRACLDDA